jgi:hypothetical protein
MPRKVVRGTGITAYEVTEYATSGEDVAALSEALDRSGSDWNQGLKEGGFFHAAWRHRAKFCEQILSKAGDTIPAEDSPEDFARTILKFIEATKNAINSDDADRAARFAAEAGTEWMRAWMKWGWEPDAIRGTKVAGGEHNAALRTNERHVLLRERRFARMRELAPSIGVDKAAAQCEIEALGNHDAIKKQWNRQRRKAGEK